MKLLLTLLLTLNIADALAAPAQVPADVNPEIDDVAVSAPSKTPVQSVEEDIRPYKLTLLYTSTQSSFEQTGDGQNYDTANGKGQGVWLSFQRDTVMGNVLELRGQYHQSSFDEPSNIGGDSVRVQKDFVSGLYGLKWQLGTHTFRFDFGASLFSQDPDNFSSGAKLVPHYLALGPTVGGGWHKAFGSTWGLRALAALSWPTYFKEYGPNSGYHDLSWHYYGQVLIEARINRTLTINLGLMAEGEQHRFDGDGDRGVEDAKVSFFALSIPVGISYAF